MYLVTIEHKDDGVWWDDPMGFDTIAEAEKYAAARKLPEGHEVIIWACRQIQPRAAE